MKQYLITYDNKPPRDYARLYLQLASWNAAGLAQSVWLVSLPGPASAIRAVVQSTLQPNDVVALVELQKGSEWATSGATPSRGADWLSKNVTPGHYEPA